MSTKKVKYNEVYISGKLLDISPFEVKWEGQPGERGIFNITVETAENETMVLQFDNALYGFDGNVNKKYEAATTIYNEAKFMSRDGEADVVRCICKIDKNSYYQNGELKEFTNLKVEYCHRQKGNESIAPGQMWKLDTLIKSMEMKVDSLGEYLEVKGLTNDYISTTGKVKGTDLEFRIHDKDMIEGFKSIYQVGSIGKLEGIFKENVIQVESKKRGFGKISQTRPQVEKWLEIVGGEESYNTIYEENADGEIVGMKGITDITDNTHPFSVDNISKMEEQIAEHLRKSKEKDDAKMAKTQTVSDEDVPF